MLQLGVNMLPSVHTLNTGVSENEVSQKQHVSDKVALNSALTASNDVLGRDQ